MIFRQLLVANPHKLMLLSSFAQYANQAGQIEMAVAAGQTDAGRHDGQIILADGGGECAIVYDITNHVNIAPLSVILQLGPGMFQGFAQLDFNLILFRL